MQDEIAERLEAIGYTDCPPRCGTCRHFRHLSASDGECTSGESWALPNLPVKAVGLCRLYVNLEYWNELKARHAGGTEATNGE